MILTIVKLSLLCLLPLAKIILTIETMTMGMTIYSYVVVPKGIMILERKSVGDIVASAVADGGDDAFQM